MERPADLLEKVFHEPNRLAIMSALCASEGAVTFGELKAVCALTDGNLNRHLKVLDEARVVTIEKRFVKSKPQTTVRVSKRGLNRFNSYLNALQDVLKTAKSAVKKEAKSTAPLLGKLART